MSPPWKNWPAHDFHHSATSWAIEEPANTTENRIQDSCPSSRSVSRSTVHPIMRAPMVGTTLSWQSSTECGRIWPHIPVKIRNLGCLRSGERVCGATLWNTSRQSRQLCRTSDLSKPPVLAYWSPDSSSCKCETGVASTTGSDDCSVAGGLDLTGGGSSI